jgi:phage tail-like protein
MRPQGPTFWLLDGRTGWRTAHGEQVSVGIASGLRLAADPGGPLGLTADDGSLGGLTLPQGMALDEEGTLYLLGQREPWVKRYEPERRGFVLLPTVGGLGSEARQFRDPANIAIAGRNLYVADRGNHRVQVFALGSLVLRYIWGPWDAPGGPTTANDPTAWEPVDVAVHAGEAYILDGRYGRVYRHQPGTDTLSRLIDEPAAADRWSRVAVDRQGRIYLLERETIRLRVYDRQGRHVGEAVDAGSIRDRFEAPPIRLDHKGRFCLPESLTGLCDRRMPARPPAPEVPLALCPPRSPDRLIFDREGEIARVDAAEQPGPRLYYESGTWLSKALDSEIHRCQWHRIELELAHLPPGTQVEVSTYTEEKNGKSSEDILTLPAHLWETHYLITGQTQPRPDLHANSERGGTAAQRQRARSQRQPDVPSNPGPIHEFLIQSREGRYLWLRLKLAGDGYATPAVKSIRVHYPRESYLNHLPAVYSTDDDSRWFLERFLSIFQTTWDDLDREIEDAAGHFDPDAVPAGKLMAYLAGWLALPLEGTWHEEQKRRLLAAAPRIYPRRGTIDALRHYLRIYLENITCQVIGAQEGYPLIVEGFRERQRLMLSIENVAALGHGAPLWSPDMVGRLQPGVFAREGEVRLVSTGDPERDILHEYAHRFRVFIPSSWVSTATDERMVRRALDAEKPAHTSYDLCLVEPRLRVGLQSTVGLDTVIGAYPVARLACLHENDAPPSRPPVHRLGYDSVLAGRPADGPTLQLAPGTRVGMDTIVT